ncbi:MAG: hypothetical protein SFU27_06895 [Thermonemataceae bacterium]|nr:hypothetical protein [Thermonemataceae bacterium]
MENLKMINVGDVLKAGGIEAYAKKHKLKNTDSSISGKIRFTQKEWKEALKILKED